MPAGLVASQSPLAGSVVVRGTPVDYVVSKGPEPTPSPTPTTDADADPDTDADADADSDADADPDADPDSDADPVRAAGVGRARALGRSRSLGALATHLDARVVERAAELDLGLRTRTVTSVTSKSARSSWQIASASASSRRYDVDSTICRTAS